MKDITPLTKCAAFGKLQAKAKDGAIPHLRELLKDNTRNDKLTISNQAGILDMTRQRITTDVLDCLLELANERKISWQLEQMSRGTKINATEKRSVLHHALRATKDTNIVVDGRDVVKDVLEVRERIEKFANAIRTGEHKGYTGKILKDVICVGIGGSYLGTEFVFEALRTDGEAAKCAEGRRCHFLANVDPIDVRRAVEGFNPEETLVIIISKTFTTAETMLNAHTLRAWLLETLKHEDAISQHVCAVSTNMAATGKFGIPPKSVFGFWDWVGGRYSVTSAVGVLPLALQYGNAIVKKFLDGCHEMDTHCLTTTEPSKNMAVMSALVTHWNTTYLGLNSVAILPYCQSLLRFAAHFQQLNMESNGKSVLIDGSPCSTATGPVVFGEPGTNGQHSFYQLVHQGQCVPGEFIGFVKSQNPITVEGQAVHNHDELMSNFFAQPDALALGKTAEELRAEGVAEELVAHKTFSGNRPSTVLLMEKCDAMNVGRLLALYEHRTAVEGFLWGINSFDQWGVELGKVLAKNVRNFFQAARSKDSSAEEDVKGKLPGPTQKMLNHYLKESA